MPLTTVLFKFFYKNNIDWSDHICEWKQEKVLGNISLYIKEKMNGPKIGHTKTPVTLNTHDVASHSVMATFLLSDYQNKS